VRQECKVVFWNIPLLSLSQTLKTNSRKLYPLAQALEDKIGQCENYMMYLFIEGYKQFCSDPELGFLSHQKFNAAVSAVLAAKQISHTMASSAAAPPSSDV
jgi:hypothetical protein